LRLQAHPRRRQRVHPLVVAIASVPVIAQVYVWAAGRRLIAHRPAIVVACLLTVTLAASLLAGGQAVATHPSVHVAIAPDAFRPVTLAQPTAVGGSAADLAATSGPSAEERHAVVRPPMQVAAEVPGVVRFRPRAGQTGVPALAAVSVRFTVAMDRASTRRAFAAFVGGSSIDGRYRWAEGDTVLVLVPSRALPSGERVTLSVTAGARSADGVPLPNVVTAAFRVAKARPVATRPALSPRPTASHHTPAPRQPQATHRPSPSGWRWPLIGPITQYFGQTLTKYGRHQGIDIDGQTGDPVRAAHSGQVIVAGHYDQCGGLEVHIDHGNGLVSWYRHLSKIEVHVGTQVNVGTVIGRVGATGCALGSHLHFAIRRGTTFVDPLRYLPPR
jgi:murein DD-endopeptidase MepM/ murein hydrolase activator NlpD